MSNAEKITLDQALDWFDLDGENVGEQQVKDAFKKLARKFHPDASGNYKGKMDGYENFIAAVDAKDILLAALEANLLPFDANENGNRTSTYSKNTFDPAMDAQDRYNYAHERPIEHLLKVPFLGPALNVVLVASYVFGLVGFAILLLPLWTLYVISSFIPDDKIKHFRQKSADYATGPFMYVAYYFVIYIAVKILAIRDAAWLFPYALSIGWFMVTIMALDEFYCMFRYWMVAKKIRHSALKLK